MAKVVAFGELLWDLLPSGKVLGGAPANFIFRVNSFGDTGLLISRVGNDTLGEDARRIVADLGLSTESIQTDFEFPTGTVEVALDEKGTPDFTIIHDVAYDHIEISSEMVQQVKDCNCLYFGSLIQRYGISKNSLKELIRESGSALKFLDVNLRKDCFSETVILDSLAAADIVKLNDAELLSLKPLLGLYCSELRNLAGEMLARFDLQIVLLTLGESGAFLINREGEMIYTPGYQVDLIDTVGSGDAFSAGFIHSYLNGATAQHALEFGNAAGALAATTRGATVAFSKTDLNEFLSQEWPRKIHPSFAMMA